VQAHQGWTIRRRTASDAEKRAYNETRRGKCFVVDGTYIPELHHNFYAVGSTHISRARSLVRTTEAVQLSHTDSLDKVSIDPKFALMIIMLLLKKFLDF